MDTNPMLTLNKLFIQAVDKFDKPDAFMTKIAGRYQNVASREVLRRVATMAVSFRNWGIGHGDRVAILAENRLEWAVTDYALLGLGAVVVPLYPTLLEPEIEFILRDSAAKGIVVSTGVQLRKILNLRARIPAIGFILAMENGSPGDPGIHRWQETATTEAEAGDSLVTWFREAAPKVKGEDVASIIYTSGTTGEPKGVVLTHANFTSNVRACESLFPLTPGDRALSFLPLSHVFERMAEYWYFWQGVSIAYLESLGALAQNLREVQPSIMTVVPRLLENLHGRIMENVRRASPLKQKLFRWALKVGQQTFPYRSRGETPSLSLRLQHELADALVGAKIRATLGGRMKYLISGAAPLARELAVFFHAMEVPVFEGYGLTETSPVIAVNYPGHSKLGTVGPIIPGVEVHLEGEDLDNAGGGVGEILIRGPGVTPGYYRQEEENQRAFTDGWFRTGDLGTLDGDGYLQITGRKKSLFKIASGKYIAPEKIENLFQGHPYVQQIMVLGSGQRSVGALIVPHFERLEEYARQRLIEFENREELVSHPQIRVFFQRQLDEADRTLAPQERIHCFELLPREFTTASRELSVTLKIKRRVVEERYREKIEKMYSADSSRGTEGWRGKLCPPEASV
jgi:long-chain acyl-CoA synthetase